jgi:hypothetical protein
MEIPAESFGDLPNARSKKNNPEEEAEKVTKSLS